MVDEALVPGSSPWWLKRLGTVLDGRAAPMTRLDDYYRGKHPLLYSGEKFRAAFGNIFSGFSDNFCALVADTVEERLDVEGFRLGADKDMKADMDAWRMWQANDLDAWSQIAHLEALVKGVAYVLVWADEDDPGTPEITVQDALEMTIATDRSSHERLVAMKRWQEEDGSILGTLYYPDRIEKWQKVRSLRWANQYARSYDEMGAWEPRAVPGEAWPLDNPLGDVPVVPIVNRPRLRGDGESEIAQVIPIQNAINKLVLDMLVASEFGSFRQRWLTGMEIPNDPDTGKPIEPFKAAVDRLWIAEDTQAKFGEFEQTDLTNYVKAIEMAIQHIASITRTPPHYFLASMGNFPSGESIKAAETGLVAKARRKQRFWGESWEEVIRLGFKAIGDARGDITDSETIWRDPESRTESEHTDAVVKMGSDPIGVPQEMLWEELGFTPVQIARMQQLKIAQQLTASIGQPLQLPPPRVLPAAAPPPETTQGTA